MAKVRQDAWSHEDDLLLAETVLRHIREGSTQLNAFEEVGDALNRTSAACGFRWNAEVRNKYTHAIDLAKRQRKEKKRAQAHAIKNKLPVVEVQETSPNATLILETEGQTSELTLERVIHFLQSLQKEYYISGQTRKELDELQNENNNLQAEIDTLEKQLASTRNRLNTVEEDYSTFIQIIERARKMTLLEDQVSLKTPSFKMDKNGNLEQLSQGQA